MFQFIIKRKVLISLTTVLIILLGGFAISKLDKELMPPVEFDGAFVSVVAGDMAAAEVERRITTPLEQNILAIDGVENTYSTTSIGQSTIQVMIADGRGEEVSKEVERVTSSITSKIDKITDVQAFQASMGSNYEFFMDISKGDMDEMSTFAKEVLEPRLEELPEVRDVALMGIQEYEMVVSFDRKKMLEQALHITEVIPIIEQANGEATLGEFSNEELQPLLRWETNLSSVEDVENISVPTAAGFITLGEIADVSIQPLENSSYVWKDGTKDFIFVQVGRTADVTQIDLAEAVRAEVQDIEKEGLLNNFEINELVAQADYVKESIGGVTDNILVGGILAIVILLLFLRNVRATLIIGISIPTSILLTFLTMWLLDYSFNMLSLIALGLGIGMMVDASIVILESIYKKKEQGYVGIEAVIVGTKEVASAVIASILTTIMVFLPIGLMGGEIGQFMIILSAVVSITLISSMLVAFTIIPALSEKFLKLRKRKFGKEGRIIQAYGNVISKVVRKKRTSIAIIGLFAFMFIGSLFLVSKVPMTIMPDVFNRYSELVVDLESGISANDKEVVVEKINETLHNIKDVESSYIIDDGTYFYTLINMTKGEDISREQKEVNEDILRNLRSLEESYPIESVQSVLSFNSGQPVQVQIKGENFNTLQTIAEDLTEELSAINGLVNINHTIETSSIEKVIELKEEEIKNAGLSEIQIQQFIQEAFLNIPIGTVGIEDEKIPFVMKWQDDITTEESLLNLNIPTMNGEKPLSAFVSLKEVETPNEISHLDGERYVTVSADIEDKDLGTINREVQKVIDQFETPAGYSISAGGDIEVQQEMMLDLLLVIGIAIFLVYLVMAVQFNHLAHPIIVMSVIPVTIVGVILGLFITQREFSIMSGMGIIMLIGIVLNNAILLVDRTNQLRKAGLSVNEALIRAGKDRIRPIFMTTLTTAFGMLPLALASGSAGNYQAPMATAIISGLLFATMITLVLVPAVYRTFHAIGNGVGRLFKSKKKGKEEKMAEPKVQVG